MATCRHDLGVALDLDEWNNLMDEEGCCRECGAVMDKERNLSAEVARLKATNAALAAAGQRLREEWAEACPGCIDEALLCEWDAALPDTAGEGREHCSECGVRADMGHLADCSHGRREGWLPPEVREQVRLLGSLFESRCKLLEYTKWLGLQVCNQRDAAIGRAEAAEALLGGQAEDIAHAYLMLQELMDACTCSAKQRVLDKYPEARAAQASAEARKEDSDA